MTLRKFTRHLKHFDGLKVYLGFKVAVCWWFYDTKALKVKTVENLTQAGETLSPKDSAKSTDKLYRNLIKLCFSCKLEFVQDKKSLNKTQNVVIKFDVKLERFY